MQANTLESYPAKLSLATWICFMGAVLSGAVTLIMEGLNAKPWSIGWDMRLFTAFYSVTLIRFCPKRPNVHFSLHSFIVCDNRMLIYVGVQGVMCSGVAYYVQGIVMKERGPVFVTAFNPLCMIITAVLGSIILGEEITLGRYVSQTN